MKVINSRVSVENKINFSAENTQPENTPKEQVLQEQEPKNNGQADKFISSEKQKGSKEKFSFPVLATTIAGTILPIVVIGKYQGKALQAGALKGLDFSSKAKEVFKSFNIEYGLKEMLITGFGSIAGGLSGGLLLKNDENKKSKIKEAIFQFVNVAIPTTIVAGLLKLTEKCKNPKAIFPKIAAVLAGIGIGMPAAAITSNKINNTIVDKDNQSKRKLKIKDCFVHVDDLVGALVLAKIPFADKLHVDKILPVFYGICGYEAGTKK